MKEELSKLLQVEFGVVNDDQVNRILSKVIDINEKQFRINSSRKEVIKSISIPTNIKNDYKLGFDKSGKPTWIQRNQLQ